MPTHKGEHPCKCTELSFKRKDGISCVTWLACLSGWFRLLNYLKLKLAFKRVFTRFQCKGKRVWQCTRAYMYTTGKYNKNLPKMCSTSFLENI